MFLAVNKKLFKLYVGVSVIACEAVSTRQKTEKYKCRVKTAIYVFLNVLI